MIRPMFICLLVWGFSVAAISQPFPAGWLGKWSGELEIILPERPTERVPMSLEIRPLSLGESWSFTITYQADPAKPDIRAYSLLARDAANGRYAIDEHNGIVLEANMVGGCLYSRFSVSETHLLSRICLQGGSMHYEISVGPLGAVSTMGGNDSLPAVQGYAVTQVTKAVLKRVP